MLTYKLLGLFFVFCAVNVFGDTHNIQGGVVFSDASFKNTRWLTVASYENQGMTIEFIHRAQVVFAGKSVIYVVDHFGHRQDRLLELNVSARSVLTTDLTSELGIKLIDDDIVALSIVRVSPLVVKVHVEPHKADVLVRNTLVTLQENAQPNSNLKKAVNFPTWITSFALWSGQGFFAK